jgi:hypothetical protein
MCCVGFGDERSHLATHYLFGLLKQHLRGHKFHGSEVENGSLWMVAMQEPVPYHNRFLRILSKMGQIHECGWRL